MENTANIGTIRIHKASYDNQRHIQVCCDWFFNQEYFIIVDDGEKIVFKKCYMIVPKKAYRLSKSKVKQFTILSNAKLGVFSVCLEESNEDELIVYYK